MSRFVIAKFQFDRLDFVSTYVITSLFVLEPGMELSVRLKEAQERARQELLEERHFSSKQISAGMFLDLQVEDNEVPGSSAGPVLTELQDIVGALDLIKAQLNISNQVERRYALKEAEANLMRRLAEFGKPSD